MNIFQRAARALGFTTTTLALPPVTARPQTGVRVLGDRSIWRQFSRIGGKLTPLEVSNIIRDADAGYMSRLVDLANESRQKDGHLHGCLSQAEESIAGLEWSLAQPDEATAREVEAYEWVESALRDNAHLHRAIAHLSGGVFYGYAVTEIVWEVRDGRIVPCELSNVDARRIGFRQSDSRLVWREPYVNSDGVDIVEAYPSKFIVSQPRVNGDVPNREGLARLLVWAALFRNWTLSDWLRLGEIAWKPWRIGTYKKNAHEEDIASLEYALAEMSTSGTSVLPETVELDVKWAPHGSNKPMHEVLYETVAREMSKAILGQTETIQSSDTSGYAQASVLNDVRKELRDARAKQIAVDLTRDLVTPLVELNFGDAVRVPTLYFNTQDAVDLVAFSNAVATLANASVAIPQAWVRDQAGIPEPSDDEPTIGNAPIEPPEPTAAPETEE